MCVCVLYLHAHVYINVYAFMKCACKTDQQPFAWAYKNTANKAQNTNTEHLQNAQLNLRTANKPAILLHTIRTMARGLLDIPNFSCPFAYYATTGIISTTSPTIYQCIYLRCKFSSISQHIY